MSSPLEKGEGVEHVAYSFRHKLVPTPSSRSWARGGYFISCCCVTSHSCRAAHETAVADLILEEVI